LGFAQAARRSLSDKSDKLLAFESSRQAGPDSFLADDQPLRGVQLRQHPRLSVSFPLTFLVDGDSAVKDGNALDIGGGGMFFESAHRIAARSLLTIEFGLRPGLNFRVRGRTVSSSTDPVNKIHRHRVVFEALPEDVRSAIVEYVNTAWRMALMSRL
jgi:hypothetical protein